MLSYKVLLVTGGYRGNYWNRESTTEILDSLTARSWRTVSAKLPGKGLARTTGATFNNNVYMLGIVMMMILHNETKLTLKQFTGGMIGTKGIAPSTTILMYSPAQDTWTEVLNMTTPRWGHAVSVVDANDMEPYCI